MPVTKTSSQGMPVMRLLSWQLCSGKEKEIEGVHRENNPSNGLAF